MDLLSAVVRSLLLKLPYALGYAVKTWCLMGFTSKGMLLSLARSLVKSQGPLRSHPNASFRGLTRTVGATRYGSLERFCGGLFAGVEERLVNILRRPQPVE